MWDSGRDRARARALAAQAEKSLAADPVADGPTVDAVRAWRRSH